MKISTIVVALTCLVSITCCRPSLADGFTFPKLPNPFKKADDNSSMESRSRRATGSNLADRTEPVREREPSGFTLPKPKLPKFELPSFARETTTPSRQSPANRNRPSEPSVFDKLNQGTKNFFSKAKTTLMPWTNETASTSQRRSPPSGSRSLHASRTNGSRNSRSTGSVREASSSNSFSFPWSKQKEPAEKEIRTPTDFLNLPRPDY